MTVTELIEKLQEMPPEARVLADFNDSDNDADVRRVRQQSDRIIWIEP